MEYTVSKGAPGKRQVSFSCPACQDRLKTPLESAGQDVECPTCGHPLLIPGVSELQQQQAEQAAAEQAADRLRQQQPTGASAALAAMAGPPPATPGRAASPIGSMTPAATPVARPTPLTPTVSIPQYRGLLTAKSVFWILAMLCYLVAAVAFVAGAVLIINSYPTRGGGSTIVGDAVLLFGGVAGIAFFGLLLDVGSELIAAFRDIAMNSFRR